MTLPIVAIIGRPNVGKSRLFNRLTGKFTALVDDQVGVTRDRHYALADWRGRSFLVIDTGGLIPGAEEPLNKKVWQQAFLAIQEADFIICLLDAQSGLTPADAALIQELRRINKPIFFAVNKIDVSAHETDLGEFAKLGITPLIGVSAEHGRGISDLLEALYEKLPPLEKQEEEVSDEEIRLAIIGRPNVGKSTLINQLIGEERLVAHDEAGTTRDAIDVSVFKEGKNFILVDTAGVKRKSATKTRVEKFSVMQSLKAIDQAQMVCLMLDATQGVTHQDLQLAHLIWEARKGLLILVNKWDLMKTSPKKYIEDLRPQLRELQSVPVLCISSKTGQNCGELWKTVLDIHEGLQRRLSTAKINQWLEKAIIAHPLPLYKGRNVKLYYATQIGTYPPHVVLFTNYPMGIPDSYRRFLSHRLQKELDIEGLPVQLSFRLRKQ
ncbi:MAG: ribosome biogenesis GTPase Der [Deltaproteobacteria bacterium]|nr:ribosome biogenesis GTPase Der [Deltaproteobacteria bacterium]